MKSASRSTRFFKAKELIVNLNYDEEFLEYTLALCRKLNKKLNHSENNDDQDDNEDDNEGVERQDTTLEGEMLPHTNESALGLYIECNLNVKSYSMLATDCRIRRAKILPSYSFIKEAMTECTPTDIMVSEVEVKVPLQSMLNKTAERLCKGVATDWDCKELSNIELHVTCGFDSSSSHLNPHQDYADMHRENKSAQQSLLVTSFIIQQLKGSNKCWINPTPQSIRLCRPLRYYTHITTISNYK